MASNPQSGIDGQTQPGTTGRFLVLLKREDPGAGLQVVQTASNAAVAVASDVAVAGVAPPIPSGTGGLYFDVLGVAVVSPESGDDLVAAAEASPEVLAVEPERIVSVPIPGISTPGLAGEDVSTRYASGYQAAAAATATGLWDESQFTWGLQATHAATSQLSGNGVKVAVLDTGFDSTHPDFAGRAIAAQSFVPGSDAQDVFGHGTHCIGTACGPRNPHVLPGYGIAHQADILVGKVLGNDGRGTDGQILSGITWAVTNGCRVVSMSLSAPVQPGGLFSVVFENAARAALAQGTVIIAAAGNDSLRQVNLIRTVGHPANCPSILAVAAIDSSFAVASFSNGGINPEGGEVNIAGPGVDVYSSWPMPIRYRRISGTSMATPHAAGIAALLAEANPAASGPELADLLTKNAQPLPLPNRDVGSGLVQAP